MTARIHRAVIASGALAELEEVVRYIYEDSPGNAVKVGDAIAEKILQLRRFPRGAPIDAHAPAPPEAAEPRVAHASGFVIRYAFPVRRGGHHAVFVVSIRRAAQPPPDDAEYLRRFLQELAGVYATSRAGSAP